MRIRSRFNRSKIYLCSLAIVVFLLVLSGCSESTPSATTVTYNQLKANAWRISSVTVDGTDQTALFSGMTLAFTAAEYSTSKGGVVWPASGTWSFTDDTGKKIKRSDNVEVLITEITDTTLKLSLNWTTGTFGPGRVSSIAGNHVFSFIK